MKTTITVTDEVTELVPPGAPCRSLFISHATGNATYVDFVDGGAGLTDENGIRYDAGDKILSFVDSVNPASSVFANGIHAVCATGESATVIVQR